MKLRIPNTRVKLGTCERFDTIVGEGERIEVPQQEVCRHELLDEDGICRRCGSDRRGI